MNRRLIAILLAVSVVLSSALVLAGCNDEENQTTEPTSEQTTESTTETDGGDEDTTNGGSNTNGTNEETTETDGGDEDTTNGGSNTNKTTEETTEDTTEPSVYADGGEVKGAGFTWDIDAFPPVDHVIDEAAATDITAAELKKLLNSKTLTGTEVFRVTDVLSFDSGTKYYGNGASVIATKGVTFDGVSEIVVKELIIKGDVTFTGAQGITLFKVDVQGSTNAVTIDKTSYDIAFKTCRVTASDVAISNDADLVSVFSTYIRAGKGVLNTGDEFAIQDCEIVAESLAISMTGDSITAKNNVISAKASGYGIEVTTGASNVLVALNIVKNAQKSIIATEAFNCVVLLNSAVKVIAEDNTNLYVVENNLGGRIVARSNNYMICDVNKAAYGIIDDDNTNKNGDNVTDVNNRTEVGADEDLLPHTNKELFVGMERKETVRDVSNPRTYFLNDYIRNEARLNSVVIVPPGAYYTETTLYLGEAHKNTTIYAYGVLEEFYAYSTVIAIQGTSNVKVNGMTFGYTQPSSGQIYIVEKLGNNKLRAVTAAGYPNDFGSSNLEMYKDSSHNIYRNYKLLPEGEISGYKVEHDPAVPGTMIVTLNTLQDYLAANVGDIYACRLAGDNLNTIQASGCTNIKFKDIVCYGYSAALAVVAGGESKNVSMERFHNTARSNTVIDEETYNRYVELEKKYGVDLEVFYDEAKGVYRGSLPRYGSVDAAHITGARTGLSMTSCLLEQMCDDGSNQRASSSRLHSIKDNGDGTTTIEYKSNLSYVYHGMGMKYGWDCGGFDVGDRIFLYTAAGKTVCDTHTLTETKYERSLSFSIDGESGFSAAVHSVTVPTDAVDFSAVAGLDLTDNHYDMTNKVLVDNLSKNSADYTIDNVLIRYTRSRGVLIKTVNVNIKHCTFRDSAMCGVSVCNEFTWGESTVARDLHVYKCLFDNIGYYNETYTVPSTNSGIYIAAQSTVVSKDTLPINNLTIEGCKFQNNKSRYAIYVSSAQNVHIINNTFEPIVGESRYNPGISIQINTAMDIEISGNTFNNTWSQKIKDVIKATNYKNIYGTDVTDENGNKLFPDP